jgi:octaprenyl-diphosphate synthase
MTSQGLRMTRQDLNDLTRPIAKDLTVFDRKLGESLQADSPLIKAVIRHITASTGKRLRPAVLFLSARSGGYHSPGLVDAALAIEIMHTATLLHDDVIDESQVRRGQLTVNHRWNNLVSVLMGDFLFSRAFAIMARIGSLALIRSISHATGRVSYGELRQIEETANYELPEGEYLRIISDKTAALFAVACEAGPLIKNASRTKIKRFTEFGENLGIAFQIADDLLDFVGDSDKTGKQSGADLMQGKVTLPLIYALSCSSKKVRVEMTDLLSNGINRRGTDHVLKFVTGQGGIDYAYSVARRYSERAAGLLETLDDSVHRRSLQGLLQFTVSRDN